MRSQHEHGGGDVIAAAASIAAGVAGTVVAGPLGGVVAGSLVAVGTSYFGDGSK